MINIVAADPENDLARNRSDEKREEESTDPAYTLSLQKKLQILEATSDSEYPVAQF
jgi:hypothetical protein